MTVTKAKVRLLSGLLLKFNNYGDVHVMSSTSAFICHDVYIKPTGQTSLPLLFDYDGKMILNGASIDLSD